MMEAETLKQEGMAAVMSAAPDAWKAIAAQALGSMRGTFTGEDLRLACERMGARPHHPNAWGAFINGCVKQGLIEPTGAYRRPISARSHARLIQVYERAK